MIPLPADDDHTFLAQLCVRRGPTAPVVPVVRADDRRCVPFAEKVWSCHPGAADSRRVRFAAPGVVA